jgi:hypothetical protein
MRSIDRAVAAVGNCRSVAMEDVGSFGDIGSDGCSKEDVVGTES